MPVTYSAPALTITLDIIADSGVDPMALLEELGIDESKRKDPNARYCYSDIDDLWHLAASKIDDDAFGLKAAKFWHPSQLGALGYAWLASSTLRKALIRFERYMRILSEGACLKMTDKGEVVEIVLSYAEISRQQPTRTDSFMAMLLAMCRVNVGDAFVPQYIALTHAEPQNKLAFDRLFKCPIVYSANKNCFAISQQIIDRPLSSSNPQLAQLNDQVMLQYLARLDKEDVVSRVKQEISRLLSSGEFDDERIANNLHMSVRTMQRKLEANNSSFKVLLNEIRTELASLYIKDMSISISEISFCLGFSETSSFSRFYKRTYGESPSATRSALAV